MTSQQKKEKLYVKGKFFFYFKKNENFELFYSDFNVIIFKVAKCDFILVSLKSIYFYETFISLYDYLNRNNIMMISLILFRNIYHKLYFIHMNLIIFYTYEFKNY